MKRFSFAHENLAPPGDEDRGPFFVDRELNAIGNNVSQRAGRMIAEPDADRGRPKAIGLTEVGARRLGALEHYGTPIRSRKTEGHANVALYLRNGLEGPPAEWFRHKATWPKVNDPSQQHAARVTLIKELHDGPTIVVGHGPQSPNPRLPERTNDALEEARDEWVEDTANILRRYPDAIWIGDPNALLALVLRALGDPEAVMSDDPTDAVLARGYIIESAPTPGSVNGVPMLTDHRKCLLGTAVLR